MAVSSATSSGTNIDVNGLVGKLMAVEQKPLTALNTKEASYQSKISAFGQVKSALSAFQTALQGLSSAHKFQSNVATSSDPSVLTATTTGSASVGSHSINVASLAQSQRLAARGVADSTASIGSGTLTFDFGTVADGTFTPNVGKPRTSTISNAAIASFTTAAVPGSTMNVAQAGALTPGSSNGTGTIPAGTLTLNGVKVDEIELLSLDRTTNIAEALDKAYVASGGAANTFTAANGKVVINATAGGKEITFGMDGKAADSAAALQNQTKLANLLGLSAEQLGSQAYGGTSKVTVASTAALKAGDPISGGGFPDGTTITEIVDSTHFKTSAEGVETTDNKGVSLSTTTVSSSKTVTIEPDNNSLEGIRDSINAAKIGVTASIVNDGSKSPNRLVLSTDEVGASNSMKIDVGGGDPALTSLLTHDPAGVNKLSEITAASNASVVIDGIPVTKTGNTINDVLPGITLNLLSSGSSTLEVARDTATVKTSVTEFVKAYNELKKIITDLTAYNPATKKGAALQGDSAMRSLDSQIDTLLSTPVGTPAGSLNTLSQIGVSKQTNGSLAIDETKLSTALGAKYNDVAGLFAAIGKATDNLVSFKGTSSATKSGNYAVAVSQLATQGGMQGNVNLSSTRIEPGATISATIDGVNASVSLTPGNYSGAQLARMLQDSINGTHAFSAQGKSVAAFVDGKGQLNIRSNTYGSSSSVSLTSSGSTAVSDLVGTAPVSTTGVDVVGTINGAGATGKGQLLTSNTGDSSGLEIEIADGALGDRGTVSYAEGYAHKLSEFVNSALGNNGLLTGRLNGLNSSVKGLSKERDTINARLSTIEDRYRRQYTKLDATLSNMGQTSTYLSQQLAKM